MMHGLLINGHGAVTPIVVPPGRYRSLLLFGDNGRQKLLPAELRVSIYRDGFGFDTQRVLLDSVKGAVEIVLTDPHLVGGISIQREDVGAVNIAWALR